MADSIERLLKDISNLASNSCTPTGFADALAIYSESILAKNKTALSQPMQDGYHLLITSLEKLKKRDKKKTVEDEMLATDAGLDTMDEGLATRDADMAASRVFGQHPRDMISIVMNMDAKLDDLLRLIKEHPF